MIWLLNDIVGDLQPRFTQGLLPLVALTLEHYTQYQQLDLKVQISYICAQFLINQSTILSTFYMYMYIYSIFKKYVDLFYSV